MPEGTQSAAHSLTELVKIAMGPIPEPLPEPSLLILSDPSGLVPLDSYMDGMFCKHENFETQWAFIRGHLLPRFLWSLLELSFKKVRLGFDAMLVGNTKLVGRCSSRKLGWKS